MSITLGLDASTKVIGWAAVESSAQKLIDAGFVDISKISKNSDKANHFIEIIDSKPWIKQVNRINVECALSGFSGGSRTQIIIMLHRWSAVFCHILEQHYHLEPHLVNASTMRKQLFGKACARGIKPKQFVQEQMEKIVDLTPWMHYNNRNTPDARMADLRDGVVAAFFR